jgi:LacI family transcriptional regulator
MGNRVTVQDIADELGLSRNTVSKALNNTEGIAEDTRQRVLDKAVELGYKQFAYAKSVVEAHILEPPTSIPDGQPREISLLTRAQWDGRHFAALMLDSFKREITQMGYTFASYYVSDRRAEALELPRDFDLSRTCAIMCIEMFDYTYDEMVCGLGKPVLFVDCPARLSGNVLPADLLLMDNYTALQSIVSTMLAQGINKVGFIGDCLHCESFLERYVAVESAIHLAGHTFDRNYYIGYNELDKIRAGLTKMHDEHDMPELFVCANDFVAVNVLSSLRDLRLRVPDDVMIIGFDDAPGARTCMPPLTTVHIHTQIMAYSAAQLIVSRLKEPDLDFRQVSTQTDLIIRASTMRR